MNTKEQWQKKKQTTENSVSLSFKKLNSSLGDYLSVIKSLDNSARGAQSSR